MRISSGSECTPSFDFNCPQVGRSAAQDVRRAAWPRPARTSRRRPIVPDGPAEIGAALRRRSLVCVRRRFRMRPAVARLRRIKASGRRARARGEIANDRGDRAQIGGHVARDAITASVDGASLSDAPSPRDRHRHLCARPDDGVDLRRASRRDLGQADPANVFVTSIMVRRTASGRLSNSTRSRRCSLRWLHAARVRIWAGSKLMR